MTGIMAATSTTTGIMAATSTTKSFTTCTDNGVDGSILPNDVLFLILFRLPVSSLLRFKSVCKSWYALINSPAFTNQHLHNNSTDLLIMNSGESSGINFSLLHTSDNFQRSKQLVVPGISGVFTRFIHMVSFNGIVCLSYYHERGRLIHDFLWNPATKQLRALPPSPLPPPASEHIFFTSLGFGLDAKTNTYKVVRLFIIYDRPSKTHRRTRVDVYNLSTDSWTTLEDVHLPVAVEYITSDPKTPYPNGGTYCWFGRIRAAAAAADDELLCQHCVVVSFDFSQEKFGSSTPLPDTYTVRSDPSPQFAILNGNIACIVRPFLENQDYSKFEVWVLNEYGVKESWTKLYTMGPFLRTKSLGPYPLRILNNGEFILFERDQQLCLYDLADQEFKNLPLQENSFCYDQVQVAMYKESLVSINRGNGNV